MPQRSLILDGMSALLSWPPLSVSSARLLAGDGKRDPAAFHRTAAVCRMEARYLATDGVLCLS
eukprot:2863768-Amphidinium_carterae.1